MELETSAPGLTVVGGGLAGSEAAWQAAERGLRVRLVEMRPVRATGAHRTDRLAELVCSNSLGSALPDRAPGILMAEMRRMDSLLLRCATDCAVAAGGALAVDRERFAAAVTAAVQGHPRIELVREEAVRIPDGPVVLASGPLTSPALAAALAELTGESHLFFFDAIAPVVEGDSIDRTVAFQASRYDRGTTEEGDYINCPFTRDEYEAFVDALLAAERIPLKGFEAEIDGGVRAGGGAFFEGCLPIEVLASRGRDALAFGPMRPVGLRDPRTGHRPHAVLQLRREDAAGARYNLVGFQTNLRHAEQDRVFRLIPGLGRAVFARHGEMHRNTFVHAPRVLHPTLQTRVRPDLLLAGQLAGIEGYLGNIATGLVAGLNAASLVQGAVPRTWPPETMTGALLQAIANGDPAHFQPVKANLGILPPLDAPPRGKRERAAAYAARSAASLDACLGDASAVSRGHE
ncbi:MAG: methylenetetrahydrofolate--tRNA-(uracil(54)-C(5))-methyltransferase (FADH(2)-oxidizing) TrmFO [Verrucomicrobia bacterium]|nr:methylenetetrahydrofolate--tRNA-(uracil(54)-C(5))-methyltransferase (FADH(2)-oxidizing) TrmFO [Verrucomicrobiota bacterium]